MKKIIKPLRIEITDDIDQICNLLFSTTGIRVVYGKPKVGKSALMYKIMHWWIAKSGNTSTPILVPLDKKESYEYWDSKLSKIIINKTPIIKYEKLERHLPLLNNLYWNLALLGKVYLNIYHRLKEDLKYLWIIDGFDGLNEVLSNCSLRRFFTEYYLNVAEKKQVTIIITCTNKEFVVNEFKRNFEIKMFEDKIVYMHLERPEYLGDDIVEIGDTRLVVEGGNTSPTLTP